MKKNLLFLAAVLILSLSATPSSAKGGGGKPVLGVAEFTNSSGAAWWKGGMGWDMAAMLSNELSSTGKFTVVERSKLEHVLKEQGLRSSGKLAKGSAAAAGKLTGAGYLVFGTISSYEEDASTKGGGLSFGGVSIGGGSAKAYVAIDLRVVNSTTGEVSHQRTIEGTSSSGGLSLGLNLHGVGANLGGTEKTPAGKAVRACLMEISEYLSCVMVEKGSCVDEYKAKESKRKAKTKGSMSLDE